MNVSSDGGLTWMADDLSTSLKTDSVKQLLGLDDIAFASVPFIASDSTVAAIFEIVFMFTIPS